MLHHNRWWTILGGNYQGLRVEQTFLEVTHLSTNLAWTRLILELWYHVLLPTTPQKLVVTMRNNVDAELSTQNIIVSPCPWGSLPFLYFVGHYHAGWDKMTSLDVNRSCWWRHIPNSITNLLYASWNFSSLSWTNREIVCGYHTTNCVYISPNTWDTWLHMEWL